MLHEHDVIKKYTLRAIGNRFITKSDRKIKKKTAKSKQVKTKKAKAH